jgi:hypothetical protein
MESKYYDALRTFNRQTLELIETNKKLFRESDLEDFIHNVEAGKLFPIYNYYKELFDQFETPFDSVGFYDRLNALEFNPIVAEFNKSDSAWEEFAKELDSKFPGFSTSAEPMNLIAEDLTGKKISLGELVQGSQYTWIAFLRYLA